jgi:predicted RNA-binding Zn ribbon-like protein
MSDAMDNQGFFRIGNNAAVDFVNTTVIRDGVPTDLCPTWDRVVLWAGGTGLLTAGERRELMLDDRDAVRSHRRAMELRAALRESFVRFSRDGMLSGEQLRVINEHLSGQNSCVQLRREGDAFAITPAPQEMTASLLLARIARHAADMFATREYSRLRRCAGEHCVLWFLDVSKNGTRRWCSMEGCGNRAKASAHYHRLKD